MTRNSPDIFQTPFKVATNFDREENCSLMSFQGSSTARALRRLSVGLSLAAFLLFIAGESKLITAQDARPARDTGNASLVDRGRYIVVGVAVCGNCHTPRKDNGELDYRQWLAGAPVPYLSARPNPDWPIRAPRIAGLPPMTDVQMITLLTTGIADTGKPLRAPMPTFHMTPADAQAVLAYLKSLTPGRDTNQ
jgi:mono/diheme cytochrome c family protein